MDGMVTNVKKINVKYNRPTIISLRGSDNNNYCSDEGLGMNVTCNKNEKNNPLKPIRDIIRIPSSNILYFLIALL